ncbi:DNA repair-scaffolding protein isoform X2 [Oryzias melastigma]|uniref:DNA repair-scaffolding protein isoform X2 n=1 Tax=Oryzias melastigma TaxID=30732 RepID=UPI00168CD876|nr:DNA repair-scaffolding protein isoform X2 [Oryzias melastigma]
MSSRKRKRYSKDLKCVFFPDDTKNGLQKRGNGTPSISSALSTKSWEKCGESFLESPGIKDLQPLRRNPSVIRKLSESPAPEQSRPSLRVEDPVHITWSSSDSDQSDNESREQQQTRCVSQKQQPSRRPAKLVAPIKSYASMLSEFTPDKDDLPVIDTDSDLEDSDCESQSAREKTTETPHKDSNEPEISSYASDGDDIDSTLASSKLDSQSLSLQTVDGSKRSVSEWVKYAQAMLQTPQKSTDRRARTPEDSAKKRRKFQSGGLAERLNRLQCRQRSAISFWRHDAAAAVDRPGVMVLEVLEVQEECGMQLALCERQPPLRDDHQLCQRASKEQNGRTLVLFNRETAAQLSPAPRDVIHIHPPWQSLSIEGFSFPVLLNTHFSQKVNQTCKPAFTFCAEKHMPYYLGKTFGLLDECRTVDKNHPKQGESSDSLCSLRGWTSRGTSLLEAVEGLGQAGSVEQEVEVVAQRVFSIYMADCSPASIKHKAPTRPSSTPPPPPGGEEAKTRLCVLVQDGCGTFSVVQLQPLLSSDELSTYRQMWLGRTCLLRGIKVLKRVTRERYSRLFSLIDSLWPPVPPPEDGGNSPSTPGGDRPAGPPPSFCYLLSGQQGSIKPTEGRSVSPLHLPPAHRTLQDTLQSEAGAGRCSFVAAVLHKRMQSDVGQREVWLVITDPSLQEAERPRRRTLAVCVSASCVLTSSVLKALRSPAVCHLSFTDVIRENGALLCVEQSVIEVCSEEPQGGISASNRPESDLQFLQRPQVKPLPRPARLDPVSVETTPNSLCSLSGVIVGVDESTAFSWPACNLCGNDDLQSSAERPQSFHCSSCKSEVDKPNMKFQLEVFLSSPSLSSCTLKLQQKTIMSVLNTTASESAEFQGCDVESVLGKEVGPITVYSRVVTRNPALWIGLEEVCL